MRVPVKQRLCPAGRYGIKCPFPRTPTRIVIHTTANSASAENEVSYMLDRPEQVSFHYAVDDREIIQALPLDRNAWASGDGHGKGNMEGIHIEICYSKDPGDARFAAAERNAAELAASLLKKYGWGMERVTKHQDYDGKYCPHRTLDLGWPRFLKLVEGYLDKGDDEMPSYEQWKEYQQRYEREQAALPVSGWAEQAVALCKKEGIMSGDGDGFRPRSHITRQEAAKVAANLLKKLKDA